MSFGVGTDIADQTSRHTRNDILRVRQDPRPVVSRRASGAAQLRRRLQQVTDIHHLLVGPAEIEGVARLDQLWPNLRAAFDWACTPRTPQLAAALVRPVAAELNLRKQTEIRDWAERILAVTPATDEDETAYWLVCATYGYKQNGDHQAYQRLAHRYGKADHPLVRYTRAYLYDDGEALLECSTEAVAWLRSHGEDHAAVHVEIAGVASSLMSTGQFAELDAYVFGNLAARGFVNAAANRIATSAERNADRFPAPGRDLGARHALEYMRGTLGEVANHEYTPGPSTTPAQI